MRDTGQPAVADPTGVKRSATAKLLIGRASAVGAKLETIARTRRSGRRAAAQLPSGGAVTFFRDAERSAVVPAMLNFTAGAANVTAACRDGRRSAPILTSRLFIDRAHLHDLIAEPSKARSGLSI
jgi:acyl-[acyl-carrier-protein]-phospholipid O-acyltransferase/long-chain-fatty-acid--[acyl-carrier-protein] ligase